MLVNTRSGDAPPQRAAEGTAQGRLGVGPDETAVAAGQTKSKQRKKAKRAKGTGAGAGFG